MKVGGEKEDDFVHLNQLREKTKPLHTILMHPVLRLKNVTCSEKGQICRANSEYSLNAK